MKKYFGCPYCLEAKDMDDHNGCCKETSAHFCMIEADEDMTLSHYFKQIGDQFQAYISYDGEHFHFLAQRGSLAVLTAMVSDFYSEAANDNA